MFIVDSLFSILCGASLLIYRLLDSASAVGLRHLNLSRHLKKDCAGRLNAVGFLKSFKLIDISSLYEL